MQEGPKRKLLRVQGFDYSSAGAYFITICTKDRKNLFAPVGADSISARMISQIVQSFKRYSTLEYIKLVKDGVLPPFDKQIWQRSFYDHIIRNREDYDEIYKYIYENPIRWQADRFYATE